MDALSAARAYMQTARASASVTDASGGEGVDFGAMVRNAVGSAASAAQVAETQALNLAAGQGDIVNVVTAIAAAETQLETVMAVRDQVIQAYQEILRMPI